MGNKLNVDGILLFEQPFARVPYEHYRKVFRTTQRNVERDLKYVQSTANELARQSPSGQLHLHLFESSSTSDFHIKWSRASRLMNRESYTYRQIF
ncbi:hypothetical protein C8R43DRAFT_1121764 [Mycena crocata]|nr:hypothetical protein C8R43DRAFT_1121764 [Mycena crocata]